MAKDAEVKGSLKLNATAASLLGFLSVGPQSGYELAARIEATIGPFWNVTRSQIYRELRALETAGALRGGDAGSRERRAYERTEFGRVEFERWIARDPGAENIRFPLLLTVFFGEAIPRADLARLLRAHRARHEATLASYDAGDGLARPRYPDLVARFGMMYERAVLAWFDSLAADGYLDARETEGEKR